MSNIILCDDELPENNYNYECIIVFEDGYEAPSDGGTVHDMWGSKTAIGWRKK